jgi:hypothetical protein
MLKIKISILFFNSCAAVLALIKEWREVVQDWFLENEVHQLGRVG